MQGKMMQKAMKDEVGKSDMQATKKTVLTKNTILDLTENSQEDLSYLKSSEGSLNQLCEESFDVSLIVRKELAGIQHSDSGPNEYIQPGVDAGNSKNRPASTLNLTETSHEEPSNLQSSDSSLIQPGVT